MFKYANETFQGQKYEHWTRSSPKCLPHFVDILESKIFTEGISNLTSPHKSENAVNSHKKLYSRHVLRNEMFYKSVYK